MKKMLLLIAVSGLALFASSCSSDVVERADECEAKCEAIASVCSDVVSYDECKSKCAGCDAAIFDKIENEKDCAKVKETISQCYSIKEAPVVGNNCEAACHNYNNRCLVHVPNATQELFDQGFESCMSVCAGWDEAKVECMVNAKDCPSMTEVCGL